MDTLPTLRRLSPLDRLLAGAGRALGAIAAAPGASRPTPRPQHEVVGDGLSDADRRLAGALMRVNHVGEVCAQALYEGQAASTGDPRLERFFRDAAAEEGDHLAWTRERLGELGARPSLLNPVWYTGAFAIGVLAGRAGDRYSLGFMVETERQVERHLAGHLERLPAGDAASRAIVDQMKRDEAGHADHAQGLGAAPLPEPVRAAMRLAARVMTGTAHRI
ncbi:MAG: 2-nonaprenyl-3-methyl-6-methoxy,4-benzoquinol hydroxylase Coq7 [Pseudomonadota bacterium]|jgi:ubiquinone biosynthesis monooxygenase Coq7